MTNLELAQQQGNQAAPNLLAAATAGELGGGSSIFPSLSTAGAVLADMSFSLDSDQADEAAASTIYNNCKLVTDNHLDVFMLTEEYLAEGAEYSEASKYYYFAFSARTLAHFKNLAAAFPEVFPAEIFDNIEPDELCTFEGKIAAELIAIIRSSLVLGVDELPPAASGVIDLAFEPAPDFELIPEGSLAYMLEAYPVGYVPTLDQNVVYVVSYYAESLLDTPAKLDKTYYKYELNGIM